MRRFIPWLIITIIVIITFWQVAFFSQSLKFDILDGYLPGHYFVGECLRNNIFPLWNPFQQLGFPIFADLSNTNYLPDLLIGRLFPYTNITFHVLLIVYIIIAGFGAYRLSNHFSIDSRFSLLAAIAYSLSGFFTGNAQHIQFIIGAAWFPFALLYFLKLSGEIKVSHALGFVIFTHLLSTGGYPSFVILLAYILFILFVLVIIRRAKKANYRFIWSYLLHCAFALTVLLVMSSGVVISILQSTPYIDRYAGLTYEYAVTNQFPPAALISLLTPLVTAAHPEVFPTDVSMNNHYFGVIILVLLLFAIVMRKKNTVSLLFLTAGLFMLLLSFGEHFFVHRLFYEYVPFFNKFRHPSSFRFVTILFLLIFTGIQVTRHNPAEGEHIQRFKNVILIFNAVVLVLFIVSAVFMAYKALGPADFSADWGSVTANYGIFGPVFIQTFIILLLNGVFFFVLFIRRKTALMYPMMTAILIIEGIAFTQMNIPYTVTSRYNPLEIRSFLRNSPAGFPLPDDRIVSENTEESVAFIPLINNTNTYSKTVSPWYRYPFYLKSFRELEQDTVLFNHIIRNKLLYYADSLLPASKTASLELLLNNSTSDKNYVFLADTVYQRQFSSVSLQHGKNDSIQCTYFSPERISFRTVCDSVQFVVLLQNNFPGWRTTIDGKTVPHHTVNRSLIGAMLPAGIHELSFEFTNIPYEKVTLFAFGIFILMLVFFLAIQLVDNRKTKLKHVYALSLLLVMGATVLALQKTVPFSRIQQENNKKILQVLDSNLKPDNADQSYVLVNTESPLPFNRVNAMHKRFRYPNEVGKIQRMLDTMEIQKFVYVWANVTDPPELQEMIQTRFPNKKELYTGERCFVIEYSKDSMSIEHFNRITNTYDHIPEQWTREGIITDSSEFRGKFEKLEGAREYSSTFRQTIGQKPRNSIRIYAEVKSSCRDSNSYHLVITLSRNGKNRRYHSVDLEQFDTDANGWRTGFAFQEFSSQILRRGDEIMVYCWNSGKNELIFLDNFMVKIEQ